MSQINVDIVAPQSGTSVTVSGVEIDSPVATNIGIGTTALNSLTSGTNNVAIGENALTTTTSTSRVVAIGAGALENAASAGNSVAVGYRAMRAGGGNNNIAIGYQTLFNGTGSSNVAVGKDALLLSTTAWTNTAIGTEAGKAVTTGGGNVLVGNLSGAALTTGTSNVFLGEGAGAFNSGDIFTGSNNIAVGGGSNPSSLTVDNEITLGNSSHTVLRCQVTSITSLSDARDKTNIEESDYGIDFVNSLKPVKFEWDTRDGAKKGVKDLGFIAQDLKELDDEHLNLVYDENPDKLEATYGRLIPVLVKAIQDLSKEIEILKSK